MSAFIVTSAVAKGVSTSSIFGGNNNVCLLHEAHIKFRSTGNRPYRQTETMGMVSSEVDDKSIVTEYFNNKGFDRWNRIYSEDGEVNSVQLDIRKGHAQTIDKLLDWIDEDGDAQGQTFCDAGCGVGSLTLPLLARGASVTASDISEAMVSEAKRRVSSELPEKTSNASFSVADLEDISGSYDSVCCIDVMIHYPTTQAADMIRKLAQHANRRLIISFAPKTFLLGVLKKVGEFFPGPSKATRAYLHAEDDVIKAIESCGMKVKRTDFTGTRFYFSKLIEAVKE